MEYVLSKRAAREYKQQRNTTEDNGNCEHASERIVIVVANVVFSRVSSSSGGVLDAVMCGDTLRVHR